METSSYFDDGDFDSVLAVKPSKAYADSQVYFRVRTGNTIRKRWSDDAQRIAKRPHGDVIVIERQVVRGVPTGAAIQTPVRLSVNRHKRWEEIEAREEDSDSRTIVRRRVASPQAPDYRLDNALNWEATFIGHIRDAIEPAVDADVAEGDDDNHAATIIMGRKGRTIRSKRTPGKKVAHREATLTDKPADYLGLEACDTLVLVSRDPTRWDFPAFRHAKHAGGGCFCCKDRDRPSRSAKKAAFRSQSASY